MSLWMRAYRRAAPDGGRNQGLVIDVAPDIPYDRAAGRQFGARTGTAGARAVACGEPPGEPRPDAGSPSGEAAHGGLRRLGPRRRDDHLRGQRGSYLAQHHAKVLMVDANTRWPALHTIARVNRTRGLLDVVGADADVRTVVQSTSVPTLFVLSGGGDARALRGSAAAAVRISRSTLQPDQRIRLRPSTAPLSMKGSRRPPPRATPSSSSSKAAGRCVKRPRPRRRSSTRARARSVGIFMNKRKFYVPKFSTIVCNRHDRQSPGSLNPDHNS